MTPRSLWDAFHDGEIVTAFSDALTRVISLDVRIGHLQTVLEMTEDSCFRLTFVGVTAFRVTTIRLWPGEGPRLEGLNRAEQTAVVDAFWAKSREVSVDADAFLIAINKDGYAILNFESLKSDADIAVKVSGMLAEEVWHGFVIRAESWMVERSDGTPFSLAELEAAGEAYWGAFAKG